MVHLILVQFLVLLAGLSVARAEGEFYPLAYLGEKDLDGYQERYDPLIFQDPYQGRLTFQDDLFFQNFFQPRLIPREQDLGFFLRSELPAGLLCTNEQFAAHAQSIRYYYRLITVSYLLEGNLQLKLLSDHFRLKNGCGFKIESWVRACRPKSEAMRTFVERLRNFRPHFEEVLPPTYRQADWYKESGAKTSKTYSHYRLRAEGKGRPTDGDLEPRLAAACQSDERLMTLICSEEDELHGLSKNRDAYYLLSLSNAVNSFNKSGEAQGCLRRYSEVMAHRERRYPVLDRLFPSIQDHLQRNYQERFLQGRVFFYGSGREFEDKGLRDYLVKAQPLKIAKLPEAPKPLPAPVIPAPAPKLPAVKQPEPVVVEAPVRKEIREIRKPQKSAFLQASELRSSSDLDLVEVDMQKLKYDYVFSLNMINVLSEKLKSFMTRDALKEMMNFDKLGTKDGPVPLLFLKYMIDMEEHQGLWNILSVLGKEFYVSNEIDGAFSPAPQKVRLVNDEASGNRWQLVILRP